MKPKTEADLSRSKFRFFFQYENVFYFFILRLKRAEIPQIISIISISSLFRTFRCRNTIA